MKAKKETATDSATRARNEAGQFKKMFRAALVSQRAVSKVEFRDAAHEKAHRVAVAGACRAVEPRMLFPPKLQDVYDFMFRYFTGQNVKTSRMLAEKPAADFSNKKSLWVVGPSGSGKSLIFKIFKAYTQDVIRVNTFASLDYDELFENFEEKGLAAFSRLRVGGAYSGKTAQVYIDDFLRCGIKARHYNNKVNMAEKIIEVRFKAWESLGLHTHLTTNYFPHEIELSAPAVRRAKQMFNFIVFPDIDFTDKKQYNNAKNGL